MKRISGGGQRIRLSKTNALCLLQKIKLSPLRFKVAGQLCMATVIGSLIGACLFIPLDIFFPVPRKVLSYFALIGAILGFLKGDRRMSNAAILLCEPLDQAFQSVPDFFLTLADRAGCLAIVPLLPLYLVLWIFNHPQALIRTALKTLFSDKRDVPTLYRACLWKRWIY